MSMVRTVRGDISPTDLGYCQTHEHIWCDFSDIERGYLLPSVTRDVRDTMILDDEDRVLEELRLYYADGGRALVEVTTEHWGRDLARLRDFSERSGVHIIATSGFYTEPSIPGWVDGASVGEIAKILVRDLEEGDPDTGVRPGLFKSGIMRARIEAVELKVLRAVVRASLETGAAVTTHTTGTRRYEIPGGTVGIEHLKIFREEGGHAHRLIVGHVDERPDINVLSELAEHGCYVQFDVIGQYQWLMDETRSDLVKMMIDRGHISRLLFGTDRCNGAGLFRDAGGLGYTHISEVFLPMLKSRAGLSDAQVEAIMIENPARALSLGG